MDFYLTAPDGSRIHFPVNPERITCDTGNRILTFDVISLGEISLPRGRVPTRFSFEGFFPGEARRNDPMVKSWRSPKELAGILSLWRNEGTKLRLLVTETPINHDVYFDGDGSFEHEWRGGHGDCWYSLRFVEARELIIRTEGETAPAVAVGVQQTRPAPPAPKTYTVKPGDTLWGIAKQTLGDGSRWHEIYNNNVDVIGKDPNLIRPGQVLRIA
jgi:LysM repeat protein